MTMHMDVGAESQTPARPDTKIAIVVRDDLATWQKLNMTAFLASAVAHAVPAAVGERYRDADETGYLAMFGQPVMIFAADAAQLAACLDRALSRQIVPAIYTEELFATFNDADNRTAVAAVERAKLNLTGIAVHALRRDVDKITKGLHLHA